MTNEETSIPTGRYRHYKGNQYTVIGTARHSETLEELVVYRQEYGDRGLWVRPKQMFCETVMVDGQETPRFRYLGTGAAQTATQPLCRDIAAEFLTAVINAFEANKRLADRAVEQIPDDKLHVALDANTNSIAVNMKHVAGNLLSRWTDFLTSDGEKPGRNRDDEFVDSFRNRADVLEYWDRGWACLLGALKSLTPEDCRQTVTIRGEPRSVPVALERSLGHTCYHIGQIVQVARVLAGDKWETLTIPRGGSQQFNEANWGQPGKSHS